MFAGHEDTARGSTDGVARIGAGEFHPRSGERVERPQYLPPRLRPIGNGVLYAYRIDIRGLEHIEVTPELGFSYPTTLNHAGHFSNGEDIRQLNYCSPLIPAFRGQREPFRDMGREAKVYLKAARHALRRARYIEEVVVRGPIAPRRSQNGSRRKTAPAGRA
jgi:hypothetical protein